MSELVVPLVPRRRVTGPSHGALRSVRRGAGSDLAGTRLYRVGDDVRRIDRRASARLSLALDRDEFVVRDDFAAEATRVVAACDRRPSMSLFPPGLPWLSKPRALAEATRLVEASAARARCAFRLVDHRGRGTGDGEAEPAYDAPEDALERALESLAACRLGAGSFVFCISDFFVMPHEDSWGEALSRGWDVVPVVVQDAVWEQSFPDVGGAVLPVWDPYARRVRATRLTRREASARRLANEDRLAGILIEFDELGLDPIVLSRHDPESVYESFRSWAAARRPGVGARP
jgi:uncharacterized protein (DUF58 family)